MKGKLLFNFEISEDAKYTIWTLLNPNPEKRPSSDNVLKLPFFQNMDNMEEIKKSITEGNVRNVVS